VVGADLADVGAELLLGQPTSGDTGGHQRVTAGHRVGRGEQRHRGDAEERGLRVRRALGDTVQAGGELVDDAVVEGVGLER